MANNLQRVEVLGKKSGLWKISIFWIIRVFGFLYSYFPLDFIIRLNHLKSALLSIRL